MLRAIKVRLYPNKEMEQEFNKVLGCYRFVYNHMLARKQEAYKADKTNISVYDLSKYYFNDLSKREEFSWLREQSQKVMEGAIRQMDDAYKNFFKHKKGFPKFKSKKDNQSALFDKKAISKKNTFDTPHITLAKGLKNIKFRTSELNLNRLRKYKETIRRATLSKTKSGNFFLSILIEMEDTELKKFERTNKQVGIDLGVKDFITTSDGDVYENKRFWSKSEKRLKKLQRQFCKKVNGSNNKEKHRIKIAKLYERITNQKDYYLHSVVNDLLKRYDVVFMEDLNVQGMLKNHNLARAISEVGFYKFKLLLEDKAKLNSKRVEYVGRFYPSSKTCSCCGYLKRDLKLSERSWICPNCGEKHDRDYNASVNIRREGERLLGIL